MKLRRVNWLLAAIAVFGFSLFLPASGFAAGTPTSGINLQISPLPIELSVEPGKSVSSELRVRNAGPQTEQLQIKVLKVTEDDNGIIHFSEPKPTDEWASWIHFSRGIFDAPPNEWQTLKMDINVPKDAAFGYYFAVEYSRATPEQPQPGRQVARGAVATFVLLNVDSPGAKREAKIVSFEADHKLYEYLPVNFRVKIRSSGNVHVAPHGNVFISKGKKQIGAIDINSAEGNILPNSSRFFGAGWDDGFPHYVTKTDNDKPVLDKKGQPQKNLKWDFSKVNRLRFGRYSARLFMVYDDGQRDVPIEATVKFWVVPWKILLVILVVVGLILFGLWTVFNRLYRTTRRKVGRKSGERR